MAQVKIIFKDINKMVEVRNIASKNSCKLIYDKGNEAIYEKENLGSFISELKMMQDLIPYIDIIPL
jgi:hypothetical protein